MTDLAPGVPVSSGVQAAPAPMFPLDPTKRYVELSRKNNKVVDVTMGYDIPVQFQYGRRFVEISLDAQVSIGDSFSGGAFAPPYARPLQEVMEDIVQNELNRRARERGYDDIFTAVSYATSNNPRFGAEGIAYRDWRDAVWAYCYQLLQQVETGQVQPPTAGELLAQLPTLSLCGGAMPTLRELDARFWNTVRIESTEIWTDTSQDRPDCKLSGNYVFRGEDGEPEMWSPRPYRYVHHKVETAAEADHLFFLCPKCFAKNGGPQGTHSVLVSLAGRTIPEEVGSVDSTGKPSRWTVAAGNTLDNLSLTPSILLDAGRPENDPHACHWHGFVGSNGVPPGHAA